MKLDDTIREALRATTDQLEPDVDAAWDRVRRGLDQPPPRRRFPVAGVAVLALFVAAVVGVVAARDNSTEVLSTGQTRPPASPPSSTTTTAATTTTAPAPAPTATSDVTTSLPLAPAATVSLGPGCEGPRWRIRLPVGWHFNVFEQHALEVEEACSSLGPEPIVFTEWGVDDGLGPASNGWVHVLTDTQSWSQALETEAVSYESRAIHSVNRYTVNGRAAMRVLYRDEIWRQVVAEWWVDAGEGTLRIRAGIPNGFDVDRDRLDALDSIVSSLEVLP